MFLQNGMIDVLITLKSGLVSSLGLYNHIETSAFSNYVFHNYGPNTGQRRFNALSDAFTFSDPSSHDIKNKTKTRRKKPLKNKTNKQNKNSTNLK